MKYRIRLVLFLGFVSLGLTGTVRSFHSSAHQSPFHPAEQKVSAPQAFKSLSISFEPNRGQFDPGVTFGSERSAYSIFLKPAGVMLRMRNPHETRTAILQMTLWLANEHAKMRGLEPTPG